MYSAIVLIRIEDIGFIVKLASTLLMSSLFVPIAICDDDVMGNFNLPAPTLGGPQFYTDVVHLDGWRIQRNHFTNHFRLLDDRNTRRAWGSEIDCRRALRDAADEHDLLPYTGKIVVLLHGLGRATGSMQPLAKFLDNAGFQVVNFQYASGRADIDAHANSLKQVLNALGDAVHEINFVGHSMGNIVVRRYLAQTRADNSSTEADKRLHRMVMLGPPNQGSQLARVFGGTLPFKVVTGQSGRQLGRSWKQFAEKLATPRFEFAIIAGGNGLGEKVSNSLLTGPDDLIVSVDETKLDGASDFVVRPRIHTTIMKHPETLEMTLRFLQHGYLVSPDSRRRL